MDTEGTHHLWTRLFTTIDKAKAFAEADVKPAHGREPNWKMSYGGKNWVWDSGPCFFTIERKKIE
jgi:hypothetical protein